MVIAKTSPVGIDQVIQDGIQKPMHDLLLTAWGLNTSDYDCYGRCYKNLRDGDYYPEVYVGNKEYKEVFLDDNKAVTSFFGVGDTTVVDKAKRTTTISIYFCANLLKLKPLLSHRADEEVHRDVESALTLCRDGGNIKSIVTGLPTVFTQFSAWKKLNSMKTADIHPFHCFRYDIEGVYSRNDICSFPINP